MNVGHPLISHSCFGLLEVHTQLNSALTSEKSIAVAVTQLEFKSNTARANFAENLIADENLGSVSVRRIFTEL